MNDTSVRLVPDLPPGRRTRKALPFADEIGRLYTAGYTLEAIRQALSAAGVTVSRSTIHREVTRAERQPSAPHAPQSAMVAATVRAEGREPQLPAERAPAPGERGQNTFAHGPSGEEVAKAFMAAQTTNPFMRQKEQR